MALKQIPGGLQAPDGSHYVTLVDGSGNLVGVGAGGTLPAGATQVSASSGNVAAAAATAVLPAAAGKTTYITGFDFFSTGATAGQVQNLTVSSLGGGAATITYPLASVTGLTLQNPTVSVRFVPALPASAVNQSITASCPSVGAGSTNACMNAFGYQV